VRSLVRAQTLTLRVLARTRSLDRRLGAGATADATPELALRARQLLDSRPVIAGCLQRALEIDRERTARHRRADRPTAALAAERTELLVVVERLRSTEPVSVRGLALAQLLVEDNNGPLFCAGCVPSLRQVVAEIAAAL
jgi:hypothetical protein